MVLTIRSINVHEKIAVSRLNLEVGFQGEYNRQTEDIKKKKNINLIDYQVNYDGSPYKIIKMNA